MSPQTKYIKGRKYRVKKDGASLRGRQNAVSLAKGETITCLNVFQVHKNKEKQIVIWGDANGKQIMTDCSFRPYAGSDSYLPAEGYLDLVYEPTAKERAKLETAIKLLRAVAEPVGPIHGAWDVIFDMEALLKGRQTLLEGPDRTSEAAAKIILGWADDTIKNDKKRKKMAK